jgi:sortase (surface protein transpeptidase)
MGTLVDRLQHRLIPALLAAVGVSFLAAGLLTYTDPVAATPTSQEPPTAASETPGPSALLTFPPLVSPSPSASVTPDQRGVATRVVVPALDIDLPVIKQPGGVNDFPPCNVAMYITQLHQPGEKGATYLYAHARTGMFLPILTASKVNNGKRMIGMLVQVYTSDDQLFLYEVVEVRRHVTTLDAALAEKDETLWLQTSEGPIGTFEKTQLIAIPLSHGPADHRDAHPKVNIVNCQ